MTSMKTVGEAMTGHVVTVSPAAIVKTAVILMKGHEIGALPVVQEALLGLVHYQELLGRDPQALIADVMTKEFLAVSPETPIFEAAELMTETGNSHLLVVQDGELVGILSHSDAIKELGQSYDPMTGLPWADALREWATNALKNGNEIAVILVDLNGFGLFNKKYGHIIGDAVLKSVSKVLQEGIDPELDFLSRYGGDEFTIASIRHADDAIELSERLMASIREIVIPEVPEGVGASYGIAGGRRTKERLAVHYAATLDDLINRASQNCTLNKPKKPGAEAAPAQPAEQAPIAPPAVTAPIGPARLKLDRIGFASSGAEATVEVGFIRDGQKLSRSATGYAVATKNVIRLVAEATAAAISASLASGYGVVVDDVMVQPGGPENDVITVLVIYVTPGASTKHVGSALVRRADPYRAAAAAVLAAINRQIQMAPAAPLQPEPESN